MGDAGPPSGLVIPVIGPLVIMLVLGPRSALTRQQAEEALNFQIDWFIAWVISWILVSVFMGLILLPIIWIAGNVFFIIGGVRANSGDDYRYPVTIRLVK